MEKNKVNINKKKIQNQRKNYNYKSSIGNFKKKNNNPR
jgi:hypothetical protein